MLIALEGIDGSGKSTQAKLLVDWLAQRHFDADGVNISDAVLLTKWNSSPIVKPAAKLGKKHQNLTPTTFALLEAADLADRHDREIIPALKAGIVVVADRWVHTAFARGLGRGLDAAWLRGIYSFAMEPDLCFFLEVPVEVALARIRADRPVKYYEAGMDVCESDDPDTCFREFQGVCEAAYSGVQMQEGCFKMIDGQLSIEDQQQAIRLVVEEAFAEREVTAVG